MVCIYCQSKLHVNNSRPQLTRNQTWRRRACKACGAVFTSIESIDLSQSIIVSTTADNSRHGSGGITRSPETLHPFERDKLYISLYESLRHRDTAASDARGLCDTVTVHIIASARDGHVAARTIARHALNTLQRFDTAAATHYAAFHPSSN